MFSVYDKLDKISYLDIQSFFSFHTISHIGLILLKYTAYAVIFLLILWLILLLIGKFIDLFYQLKQKLVFLEITPPLVTEVSSISTTKLFCLISELLNQKSLIDKLLSRRPSCSCEIVSTKKDGIRYILHAPESLADVIEKDFRSYIPGTKVRKVLDYLPDDVFLSRKIVEYKMAEHFSLPINEQADLSKHDPLAYIAGNMTQLKPAELMAVQIILRPLSRRNQLASLKAKNNMLTESRADYLLQFLALAIETVVRFLMIPLLFLSEFAGGSSDSLSNKNNGTKMQARDLEPDEIVKNKLSQPLFETTIRTVLIAEDKNIAIRDKGLRSSFASFMNASGQALRVKRIPVIKIFEKIKWWQFKKRHCNSAIILSSSEVSALYHFPFSSNNQTEDLIRVRSKELPAPLSMKNNKNLDVVFGKNTFGNTSIDVGLTDDDRSRHVYLIGQTGSGKSTIIYHMASDDIKKGRGLALVDPHGDLAEGLISEVPDDRIEDTIYFNPYDIKYPVGINLLEINEGLNEDELDLEKELVCESVVSIFRRVFFKDESTDAHRIEYILRNTIYTSFFVPERTIFTIYDLLNDASFRKQTIRNITDENLIKFWKNEFGKAGDFQHVKMVSGVTSKVGRFLFSPIAKRILEQPKSTINFDEIINNNKVLLCNLSEGKLGEDTSMLLGATIIAKVHQASVRRARISAINRTPFYLFVDEFQNFATSSFTKLLSGGRKFGLRITIAEQSTSQQDNRNITNVVLANTGTVICFRTASPVDEELMLSQFAPQVVQGDIGNLPRYHFYMRLAAIEPEAPFSGITLPITTEKNQIKTDYLIQASRKNYAIQYIKKEVKKINYSQEHKQKKEPGKQLNNLT